MKVLALSHTYEPIGVLPWQKAITLLLTNKVYIVSEYDSYAHSPSTEIKIPSVVVFKNSKRGKMNSARFSRKNVWVRDEGRCQYCGTKVDSKSFTLDHIVPKTRGGGTNWTNVVTSCYPCNQKKADKPLAVSGMTLIKQPARPATLPYIQDVQYYNPQNKLPDDWKFWLGQI